jgi:acyl-CoA oxidase
MRSMPDFTDKLKPADPLGPSVLSRERNASNIPVQELAKHLLSRNGFLQRQARILPILQKETLFRKIKQSNLSRPERYHLGLARTKKLRRLADQYQWNEDDQDMATYLVDDVSPYMVHSTMFITTMREQGNKEQQRKWLPRMLDWEIIGCYAQ